MPLNLSNYLGGENAITALLSQLLPGMSAQENELRIGDLEVRLTKNDSEIQAAQALRYHVFYEELGAQASSEMASAKRDFDEFDDFCDHMIVIDHAKNQVVVGTYRLLRSSAPRPPQGFYTQGEYNIASLLQHEDEGELLEVGRSCVAPEYRTRQTLDLLWRGIASYVQQYDVKLIFGCASFPGTDVAAIQDQLDYLYTHHLAPPALRPIALTDKYIPMTVPNGACISAKQALQKLPPLIKGYLRLGGFIGDGAVIDRQWGSIDVAIVVKTDMLTGKYAKHYGLDKM